MTLLWDGRIIKLYNPPPEGGGVRAITTFQGGYISQIGEILMLVIRTKL